MKRFFLPVIALLLLAGCPQVSPLLSPGTFNAGNSKTSPEKPEDRTEERAGDSGKKGPEAAIPPPPAGDTGLERRVAVGKPIDPANDQAGVGPQRPRDPDGNTVASPSSTVAPQIGPYVTLGPPIQPPNDQAGVWIDWHYRERLRHGQDNREILPKLTPLQIPLRNGDSLTLNFLLEKIYMPPGVMDSDPLFAGPGSPLEDGSQVRVFWFPDGERVATYCDVLVNNGPLLTEGFNLSFSLPQPTQGEIHFAYLPIPWDIETCGLGSKEIAADTARTTLGQAVFGQNTAYHYLGYVQLTAPATAGSIQYLP